MTPTRLGPYEILAPLGAGGMGEVYRAKDPKLGREVAIKVLPEGFAADIDRLKRFEQEARSLSVLNHPNILTVHDLGSIEGTPFLVMELLEGETLRGKLGGHPLPSRKAADIALQAARGLAAAHEKGILHRDIKPDNLFICRDGRVKILDFGLAKLQPGRVGSESATRAFLSEPGTIVGTSGYMSPEQVQGEALDARSDLFSLGVVLWEMLTGRAPFQRDSAVETLHAILKEEPPDLDPELKVPPGLVRILDHCLAKDPSARFHSATDLAFALETLSTVGSSGPGEGLALPRMWKVRSSWMMTAAFLLVATATGLLIWRPWLASALPWDARTVAILPFENRTGDPGLEPLGQQIVDLVRQDLQAVDRLAVAADQVVPSGPEAPRVMARATRARFVAAGAFYLKGSELEFQARLVDPWAGKVVGTLGPWRSPRADPAPALGELRQHLGGFLAWAFDEFWHFEPGSTTAPRLDAFLAFRKEWKSFGRDYAATIAACQQALELDPGFFMARAQLFFAFANQGKQAEALPHLQKMEADYTRLTPVERCFTRWMRADLEGRLREEMKVWEDLKALHPDTYAIRYNRALSEAALNRTSTAIRSLSGIPPNWFGEGIHMEFWPASVLGLVHHQAGDYAGQLKAARAAQASFPDVLTFHAQEAAALAALGRLGEMDKVLETLPTTTSRGGTASGARFVAALELRAHRHLEASRMLAERVLAEYRSRSPEAQKKLRAGSATLLTLLGRPEEALALIQALHTEAPENVNYQGWVGVLQARLGRTGEARKVDAELQVLDRPYLHGQHTFARACIAAQLGEKERAVALLRQALGQGLAYSVDLHRDLDLEPLRGYPPYEELLRPKD